MIIRKIIREELQKIFEADYYDRFPDFLDPQFNPQMGSYPPVGMHAYGTMVKEEELDEAMTQIGDIQNLTLIIDPRGESVPMILMDLETGKIYGVIDMHKVAQKTYDIVSVAAEKGFGPLMYEFAMMYANTNGVMPFRSGDITDSAADVWKKFYDRSDIKKEPVTKEDVEWSYPFDEFLDDSEKSKEEMLELFNTKYYKTPTTEFNELVLRGQEAVKEKKLNLYDVIERAGNYFAARYS